VSEKIALGLAQPSGQEMQFDQRLFNQVPFFRVYGLGLLLVLACFRV
jgi:hypothetical protein